MFKLQIIKSFIKVVFLFSLVNAVPSEDLVKNLPNYPYKQEMYSGYLDTSKPDRKIHCVFVPSQGIAYLKKIL